MHAARPNTSLGAVRRDPLGRLDLILEAALGLTVDDRFEVRVDVAALVPVVRPNFDLTRVATVFEPGVAIRAGTAAVVRF
jgi:hypothetical protein